MDSLAAVVGCTCTTAPGRPESRCKMSKSKKQIGDKPKKQTSWDQWAALPEYVREQALLTDMGLLGQDVKEYPFLNKGCDIRLSFEQQDVFRRTSGFPISPERLQNYLAEHGYQNTDSWSIYRILDALQNILDKKPDDLITLTVAISKYKVKKVTLRRAIKDKRLKNYGEGTVKNSIILVSEKAVAGFWPK
jgi:hypothetical protein